MKDYLGWFMSHVLVSDKCWEWTGAKNYLGYGRFKGPETVASRMSWVLFRGQIPEGRQVCHHCDNPGCVRPDHLFVGTSQENVDDAVRKGRVLKGEKCSWSKLKESDVLRIKTLSTTNAEIARMFGVARSTISLIKSGKNWKHL